MVQNMITQLSALFLGIIAGSIVCWLSKEELPLYEFYFAWAARGSFVLTLLLPLLYSTEYLLIFIIILSYCFLGMYRNREVSAFYLLSPFSLFLISTGEWFLAGLAVFFLATVFSITLLITSKKEMWKNAIALYVPFIIVTVLCYILL